MTKRPTQPLVSVVVLNYNGLDDTLLCIESVKKQTYQRVELIVVDNGSVPEQKAALSKIEGIIYIDNPRNRGFTGGHIDGLMKANGDFILLLNNDAVTHPAFVERALPMFDDPLVAAVGGRAYSWNDEAPIFDETNHFYSYMNIDPFSGEAIMQSTDYGSIQEVNVVSGSAVMIRRSVIDEVGYLYDGFFAYFEETDLFARMKRAGYKVLYNPRLSIWHKNGVTSERKGSRFFFYQIFRNRFIFAMRNFEPWFLRRFLLIYLKIAFVSLLQIFRDRANRNQHVAYVHAAWSNLILLPRTVLQRYQLQRSLGKSHYNHQIIREQTGISIVVDGTALPGKQAAALFEKLQHDTNPLHEYLLVVTDHTASLSSSLQGNVRYVVNRGQFSTHPVNLGCIAARFPWIVAADHTAIPGEQVLREIITMTAGTHVQVVGFRKSPTKRSPYVAFHSDYFKLVGGLGAAPDVQAAIDALLQYASASCMLMWAKTADATTVPIKQISGKSWQLLREKIALNRSLIQRAPSWFDRIQNKYYRVYQLTTFTRWLGMRSISPRLKLGRLKNLVIFAATFRIHALAIEFKHIRNEVLLHSGGGMIRAQQAAAIKKQLATSLANPSAIPIFIVCFERVADLQKLVAWLEWHKLTNITFIDNGSTYQPLLNFFAKTPYQVLRLYRNAGHTAPWSAGIIRALAPESFYIVTDPDVLPSENCPDDFLSYFLRIHKQFPAYQKVGFGLKIDDLPDSYALKRDVIAWEEQFWKHALANNLYEAGIDTTLALYKPFTYHYILHPSIRTGEPYTARHLPWYHNPTRITEEDAYYRYRADRNINSWNTGKLPERYLKKLHESQAHA